MQEAAAAPVPVGTAAVVAFVAYLALVIAIGFAAARFSSAGVGEFFVGGRRMHRFVVALSAVVSGRLALRRAAFVTRAQGEPVESLDRSARRARVRRGIRASVVAVVPPPRNRGPGDSVG